MSAGLEKTGAKGQWRRLAHCLALCLLLGCEPRGREAHYLFGPGPSPSADTPTTQLPALPEPPDPDQLHLTIPASNLDSMDFLALSGCAVQATIGKRHSNLGRMARDSQRLLLALEYLRLAPRCITYQRQRNVAPLADTLERAWQLQRQQLPALIFNATLGGAEYRALWHTPAHTPGESRPGAGVSRTSSALVAINDHTRRWLAGDYQAGNRDFEILLSTVASDDNGSMAWDLTAQSRRYCALLLPVATLERQLSSALPPHYRDWRSARNARLTERAVAARQHEEQRHAAFFYRRIAGCLKSVGQPPKMLDLRHTTTSDFSRQVMVEERIPEDSQP